MFTSYIKEAQYADDIAIFFKDTISLQVLLSVYNSLSQNIGLQINTKKTETVSLEQQADFYINGQKLTKVDHFKYGSFVSSDYRLDKEILLRIQAASRWQSFQL